MGLDEAANYFLSPHSCVSVLYTIHVHLVSLGSHLEGEVQAEKAAVHQQSPHCM